MKRSNGFILMLGNSCSIKTVDMHELVIYD